MAKASRNSFGGARTPAAAKAQRQFASSWGLKSLAFFAASRAAARKKGKSSPPPLGLAVAKAQRTLATFCVLKLASFGVATEAIRSKRPSQWTPTVAKAQATLPSSWLFSSAIRLKAKAPATSKSRRVVSGEHAFVFAAAQRKFPKFCVCVTYRECCCCPFPLPRRLPVALTLRPATSRAKSKSALFAVRTSASKLEIISVAARSQKSVPASKPQVATAQTMLASSCGLNSEKRFPASRVSGRRAARRAPSEPPPSSIWTSFPKLQMMFDSSCGRKEADGAFSAMRSKTSASRQSPAAMAHARFASSWPLKYSSSPRAFLATFSRHDRKARRSSGGGAPPAKLSNLAEPHAAFANDRGRHRVSRVSAAARFATFTAPSQVESVKPSGLRRFASHVRAVA
mmetsp:Transcript_32294/g.102980  ORF Transcript_32294/g.102980 Transcript_32294/m.102980 type:complete len:399 (+) Transcript_32294:338-1534(+)